MLTERKKQLGTILETICEELDVTPSQYDDAKRKYTAVGDWLSKPDSELYNYDPEIYPQGSIRLGTAVKPLEKDEFDVDLVCVLNISSDSDQGDIKRIVGHRMAQNEKYKQILQEKNRCWRLDYAGQFHLDILPAIPDIDKGNCCIFIPDRELKEWKPSNPKGYAKWFESRMFIVKRAMLEARAEVEDLPDNDFIRTPLQRSVQILKRHRDIAFKDDKENAPVSIIITTLAAKAYNNESDLYEGLTNIINGMPDQVDIIKGLPAVLNPTNPEENFADKWMKHSERFWEFRRWLQQIQSDLTKILDVRDMRRIQEGLVPMFGKRVIEKGMVGYAEKIEQQRKAGSLKMSIGTGLLGSTGIAVRKNTFYGI
jgi:hypothetical protein